jgi:hypothetical protein
MINDRSVSKGSMKDIKTRTLNRTLSTLNQQQLLNPGPGNYESEIQKNRLKSKSPSCTIGNTKRNTFLTITFSTPGPGNYNQDTSSVSKRGPTYKIGVKISPKRDHTPGPGSYHTMDSPRFSQTPGGKGSMKFSESRRS